MKDISCFVKVRNSGDYQRDNFDSFLQSIDFCFDIPVIHITGTNGKGSVTNYLYNAYLSSGLKVGKFTSPYFYEINEMIETNGKPIDDNSIFEIINDYKKEIEKFELSPFEIQTFIAFEYFKKQNIDLAIIECGMGGSIDATNIVNNVMTVITSVSLEHTEQLGVSISEIAENKAGIISSDSRVVVGNLEEDALKTVIKVCKETNSSLKSLCTPSGIQMTNNSQIFNYGSHENIEILSLARYEVEDACIALETMDNLMDLYPVKEKDILQGFRNSINPLRFEIINDYPRIIIDGAHNPESIETLEKSLTNYAKLSSISTLFACFKDKNLLIMMNTVATMSEKVIFTTFPHQRARKEEDYFLFMEEYSFVENPFEALEKMLNENPDNIFVITGSLAFAAYMKKAILEGKVNVKVSKPEITSID